MLFIYLNNACMRFHTYSPKRKAYTQIRRKPAPAVCIRVDVEARTFRILLNIIIQKHEHAIKRIFSQ